MKSRKSRTTLRINILGALNLWNRAAAHEFHENEPLPEDRKAENMSRVVMIEYLSVFVLIFTLGFMAICYFWDSSYVGENPFFWFQRSGALLVSASVGVEYFSLMKERDAGMGHRTFERPWVHLVRKIARPAGIVFGIFGTVIWAYGDLCFR